MNKKFSIFICWILTILISLIMSQISQGQNSIDIEQRVFSVESKKYLFRHAEAFGITAQNAGSIIDTDSPLINESRFVYRYVSSLAISPKFANDRTIFAAVYNGGVFKSTNGGISWVQINNGLDNLQVNTLAISPNYPTDQTIFAGSTTQSSHNGVFKSTDGGSSWVQFSHSPGDVEILAISPDFSVDQTIFLGSNGSSVMRSSDGGVTWVQRHPGESQVWALALSPNFSTDHTVLAGGIYKSTNRGESWVRIYGKLILGPDYQTGTISFSPNFANDSTVFAGTYLGLIRSTDGDSIWNFVLPLAIGQVVFSPEYANDQTVFAAGAGGVFKSTNGGNSWVEFNSGLPNLSVETLAISPNYPDEDLLFAGTHQGIFRSENGEPWTPVNDGLLLTKGITQITNSPFQFDGMATLSIDNLGIIHVAWEGTYAFEGSPEGIVTEVFYMNNQNGVFGPSQEISVPIGFSSISISLATDSENYAHIAFRRGISRSNNFDDALYYVNNRDDNFQNPILIKQGSSRPGGLPWFPSLAVDKSRNAHISFVGLFTSHIWYTNNVTGSFISPIEIPSPEYSLTSMPSLAIDSDGNAHIAYQGEVPNDYRGDVFYVNNIGGSFNLGINISQKPGFEDRPQLVLDNFSRPHIVYPGYYSYMEIDDFATPTKIAGGARPSIVLDDSYRVHISSDQGRKYTTNREGPFKSIQLFDADVLTYVGPRCIGVSRDDSVHVIFFMCGSRIIGDFNYELYYLAFPLDEIGLPELTINDVTVVEGNQDTVDFQFKVSLSALSTQPITVDYITTDGTAIADSDYVTNSGTLSFLPGTPTQTITIAVRSDLLEESDETFFVNLSNPTNAIIADNEGQCTILDDDGLAEVLIWVPIAANNISVAEKAFDSGLPEAEVRSLVKEPKSHIALQAALEANGKSVLIVSDITLYDLFLFEAVFAVLGVWPNEYMIPADYPEALVIENYILGGGKMYMEGNDIWYTYSGYKGHNFCPLFSLECLQDNGGYFTTIIGSNIVEGMDFNYNGNSFSNDVIVPLDSAFLLHSNKSPEFGCGVAFDGGNYKTIAVSHEFGCLEDGIATKAQLMEAYLNFFEIISPPTISINDVTVTEGDTGTNSAVFTVSLSAKFMQTVKIDYVTEESSAISDSDFIATSGTLSFPTGITTQTFTVLIVGDDKDERDETFFVNLSNPTNATLADSQGQCTIIDNDKSTLKVTYDFPLKTGGWYLISLPVIPEDSSVTALFPTALAAFGWDFKSQNYVSVTKLESNRGYWLEVPSATKNELWGQPINSYTHNYTEHQGWDLIGSVFESSSLLDEPDGSVVAVFDWDSMSQMYISIPKGQPLQPNKGYWIEVYGIPCTVTIGSTGLVSSSGIRPIRDVERKAFYTEFGSEPPPSPSFLIKDNRLVKIPRYYSLSQNFPNPFNSETIIEYTLPEACKVQLQIFNIIGEEVTKLVDKWQETGFYQIRWDGKGLSTESVPSGVYLYKFTTKKFTKIKKLLIIK